MTHSGKYFLFAFALIGFLWLNSCDNTMDPTDTEYGLYSVHGYLDLLSEISYIRVRDLNVPFTLEASESLDARVELQNLDTGNSTLLDSDIREYKGVYLHTFYYEGVIEPDTEFLLSVERSDGVGLELTTRTPTLPEPLISPVNEPCNVPVKILFEPMNGGTIVLRFGLGPDKDDDWSRAYVLGPERYSDSNRTGLTITPANTIAGISLSNAHCSVLLSDNNLYMSVSHYSPGFYEQVTEDVTDILETTQRFGAYYSDTLAIPLDTSR